MAETSAGASERERSHGFEMFSAVVMVVLIMLTAFSMMKVEELSEDIRELRLLLAANGSLTMAPETAGATRPTPPMVFMIQHVGDMR